jgi:Rrf2 family nitric oxide-sensitive transcriptional repressor
MFYLHKKEFDYALRICAYLAGLKNNEIISVNLLSKQLLVSKPFTTKIVYNLRRSGIIASKQGKYGGIYLTKDPNKLNLLQILESVGLSKTISDCINEKGFCPLPAPCKMHSFFMKLEENLIHELSKKTISNFAFTKLDLNKFL